MDKKEKLLNESNKLPTIAIVGSPSDTFIVTIDILEESSKQKLLGELVFFLTYENDDLILSVGQITYIKTLNRWHEEPSFKAVIKRHGKLPHLSDVADNRIAEITIQSSFKIQEDEITPYKLSNSPSTGAEIKRMSNNILKILLEDMIKSYNIEYLGYAYETDVEIPFWFKHFGKKDGGVGEAYHIGVFGRTGSGKTTTAAQMIKGYANNSKYMSILILDPQEQFYNNIEILPNENFENVIKKRGMNYRKIKIPEDVYLPNDAELFAELLNRSGFIKQVFNITTPDKQQEMTNAISNYFNSYINHRGFEFSKSNNKTTLDNLLNKFTEKDNDGKPNSFYLTQVYSSPKDLRRVVKYVERKRKEDYSSILNSFTEVLRLFKGKQSLDDMVENIVKNPGNFFIINLAPKSTKTIRSENIQALLIKLITQKIIDIGEELYQQGEKANCLIVMDEAHRYLNASSPDPRIKELNRKIVDAVRTTRKYGVGYMFITQTLASIDDEIIKMMRIFAFGYGLTMSNELSAVKQIINDEKAITFYRSFIDPASNNKYPFMFHGPISPLSFTGSPLFIDMK